MSEFIPPPEAFRTILRAIYPQNPRLPDRIKSKSFFVDAQRKYKFRLASPYGPEIVTQPVPDHVLLAFQALYMLRNGIREGKITLQGSRGPVPPAPIVAADCVTGELDVWAETLEIHTKGVTDYSYRRVWCSQADVAAIINQQAPPKGRTPPEVTRGQEALRELYGDQIPGPGQLSNGDLHQAINAHMTAKKRRPIAKDSLMRAAGRRSK